MNLIYFLLVSIFLFPINANAYIGIGPLLPLIGTGIVYIFLGIIFLLGFIFYPVKKLISFIKSKKKNKLNKNGS
tara:strand:- start:245 stop:466 length:222 start_codon:yes stop_codon:yes gene_type:complete